MSKQVYMSANRLRQVITEGYDLLREAVRICGVNGGWLDRANDAAVQMEQGSRRSALSTGRCMYNVGIDCAAMSLVTVQVVGSLRGLPVVPNTWGRMLLPEPHEVICFAIAEGLLTKRDRRVFLPESVQEQADLKLVMQKMLTHISGHVDYDRDIAC